MARRATLRASDSDREHVTLRLKQAATEGRLAPEELEQRLEAALSARTYGELDAVLVDLPSLGRAVRTGARREQLEPGWLRPTIAAAIAVPLMLAAAVLVVFAVTGVFAVWALWIAAGWFFFGRRRRHWRRYSRAYACGHWLGGRAGLPSSRGSWV